MHIHYLPIATTLFAAYFAVELFRRHWHRPGSYHLLWWGFGITTYGIGTLLESLITLFGWSDFLFRSWYIAGALMGGAPLAQGSVYLFIKRRTAHIMSGVLIAVISFGAVSVFLTPLDYGLVDPHLPQGNVIIWKWVRLISPFINTYAFIFLVGGAIASALKFRNLPELRNRFAGNSLIAVGAILPGIGGAMSRAGFTEVLYVAEFIGLILIFIGYRQCIKAPSPIIDIPQEQVTVEGSTASDSRQ